MNREFEDQDPDGDPSHAQRSTIHHRTDALHSFRTPASQQADDANTSQSATFVFAAGGTGGHIIPGIAVAERLLETAASNRVLFVGSERPIETSLVRKAGFAHHALPSLSLADWSRHPWRFLEGNWRAYRAALQLLKHERPVAVIGCGGFASAASLMAALRLGIPILLLEQNVIPGRVTRLFARFAAQVCTSFPETSTLLSRHSRCVCTGNPVRAEISRLHVCHTEFFLASERQTLLVLGGSQGARSLNSAMMAFAAQNAHALRCWHIVHQTGVRDEDSVRSKYVHHGLDATVAPFFSDMAVQLARADLIVSRAGGTTLAEVACGGRASVLVPFRQATHDHQRHNAEAFLRTGASDVVLDTGDEPALVKELSERLTTLMTDRQARDAMGNAAQRMATPCAADEVAQTLLQMSRRSTSVQRPDVALFELGGKPLGRANPPARRASDFTARP